MGNSKVGFSNQRDFLPRIKTGGAVDDVSGIVARADNEVPDAENDHFQHMLDANKQTVNSDKNIDIDTNTKEKLIENEGKDRARTTSEEIERNRNLSGSLKLLEAGVEIINAGLEFDQIESRNALNSMILEGQRGDILDAGREGAFREETKGFVRGEQSKLSAAARGQSVSGGIARSAQLAEETYGIVNANIIETNSIRQALGIDQKQLLLDHETNIARINRDFKIASSALSGVAGGAGAFI